jgi:hypothetical protein
MHAVHSEAVADAAFVTGHDDELTSPPPARPADFRDQPGYRADVDVNASPLSAVIDTYSTTAAPPCGIRGCDKSPAKGLLVRFADGTVTHVGRTCGKRHFGASLAALMRSFEQQDLMRRQQAALAAARARKPELLARLGSLRHAPIGTDWFMVARKELLSIVGPDIATALHERARRGDAVIEVPPEWSAAGASTTAFDGEVDAPAAPDAPAAIRSLGTLAGLPFINSYPELQLETLRQRIFELDQLDVDALSPNRRRDWVRWAEGVDEELAQIAAALTTAVVFLQRPNVELLYLLSTTVDGRARAKRAATAWKLPKIPAGFS